MATDILRVLKVAHQAVLSTATFKPDNVMITPSGHVKLMDFGIARDVDRKSLTQTGTSMGTPLYMSPSISTRSASRPPPTLFGWRVSVTILPAKRRIRWHKNIMTLFACLLTERPVPSPRLLGPAGDLAIVVMKCWSGIANDRFRSAEAALARALHRCRYSLRHGVGGFSCRLETVLGTDREEAMHPLLQAGIDARQTLDNGILLPINNASSTPLRVGSSKGRCTDRI